MGIAYFVALASLLVQGGAPAPAPTPQPVLEPVGRWVAQFEPSFCAVSRRFGDEKDGPLLVFKTLLPNDTSMDIILITQEKTRLYGHVYTDMVVTADDGRGKLVSQRADTISLNNQQGLVRKITVDTDWIDSISDGRPLRIRYGRKQTMVVHPEGLASALKVLGQCQITLAQYWKLDTDSLKRMKVMPGPIGTPSVWLTSKDYPVSALSKGHGGFTIMAWDVETDGLPSNCRILQSSGDKILDDVACNAILKRARFKPAIDVDGKPMKSFLVRRVAWIPSS